MTRASWLPWLAIGTVVAALGAWTLRPPAAWSEAPLAAARFIPLTNWDGAEEGAEIFPDGRFAAFLADHDGEFDIWLTQIGTGHFTNLTRDFPPLAPLGAIVRKLGFSGDGTEIWFNPAARKPLLLMPITGGTPRAFLGPFANTPGWSPDGSRLVYFQKPPDGDDPMQVADRTGARFFFSAKILIGYLAKLDMHGKYFLELGAGTCLISILASKHGAFVTASDLSLTAVYNIEKSVRMTDANVEVVHSGLFDDIPHRRYDYIIINPPYYRKNPSSEKELAWFGGDDFQYFRKLFSQLGKNFYENTSQLWYCQMRLIWK